MIHFEKVTVKNLFAFGNTPTEIQLDKTQTTLIIGQNGAGKSAAIIDSIHLALFNSPFRDIPKPCCINTINNGQAVIEIFFTKGQNKYRVVRGLKPTKFEIYENDNLLNQEASARDYQAYLEETILDGLNEKVFRQVVMIGSANYIPFMQLKTAQRREVIEELLDIKIFSSINALVKDKMSWYKDTIKELDRQVENVEQKISILTSNQKKLKDDNDSKIAELKEKIAQYDEVIKHAKENITALEQKRDAIEVGYLPDVDAEIGRISSAMAKFQVKQKDNDSKIAFFEKNCTCETCEQTITEEHKALILAPLKLLVPKFVEAIETCKKKLDEADKKRKEIYMKQIEVNQVNDLISPLLRDMNTASSLKSDANNQITKLSANALIEDSANDLKVAEIELDETKSKRVKELDEKKYYDVIATLLKDGGIKTKIIQQYIPIMNKTINEYLVRFGLPIEFNLDEEFNEVIKSRYRDTFKYNNFSQGEKQRIDMALLLAWREIARSKNTTNCNLLILDETFDSSLDEQATDELLNILLEMGSSNIFVISHKGNLDDKLNRTLEFYKQGNFSYYKEK